MSFSLRKSAIASMLVGCAFLSPALADTRFTAEEEKPTGFYVSGAIGGGSMTNIDIATSLGGGEIEFETGLTGDIGIGYDFGNVRTELSYNKVQSPVDNIQNINSEIGAHISSVFLSASYDWRAEKKWQPYITAGIGSSEISAKADQNVGTIVISATDDNVSTLLFKFGVTYAASEKVDVYGETWGQAYDDFQIGNVVFSDCVSSGASLGVRVRM